uniref:Biopolymer transport proteins n=1 Tax=uncultured Rhizobium sp. HF0500_35F13 TaxID=723627 RepID=E7C610_9HYPH|nr:biopolymer transport proteins [uncultured Rhizobium sp. HF0500_35F13]
MNRSNLIRARWASSILLLVLLVWISQQLSVAAQQPAADAPAAAAVVSPAAAGDKTPSGFFGIVFAGGISGVVIMISLLGLSLSAAYLAFEQLLTLRHGEMMPDGLDDEVRELIKAGQFRQALELCAGTPSLLAVIIRQGIVEVDGDWNDVEKAMEDATEEQSAQLFRRVEYLSVIGNIAPMVGLLGTVIGMIVAFQEVAATQGSAGAGDLAAGIYQALVTTVGGLIVAIPSLGAFAVFRNRIDQLVAEAAHRAQRALVPIKRRSRVAQAQARTAASPPPPPPPNA